MGIPKYFEFSRPLLNFLAKDSKSHSMQEIYSAMAEAFNISKEEQQKLLPSGIQTIFKNRVSWAKQDLFWCGLISRENRGVYKITKSGLLESKNSKELDRSYLTDKYPNLKEKFSSSSNSVIKIDKTTDITAEESISNAYEEIKERIASDLTDNISKMSPYSFEQLVVDLLNAMGYGGLSNGGGVTKKSNDEGIDGIINQDKLGLDVIYLQAKRWQSNVGSPEIQNFVGALEGKHATKGIFITTSKFSKKALNYAQTVSHKIILIDGDMLAKLMIDYNVGVSTYRTIKLKRVDSDYFDSDI